MKKSTISKLLICAIILGFNSKINFAQEVTETTASNGLTSEKVTAVNKNESTNVENKVEKLESTEKPKVETAVEKPKSDLTVNKENIVEKQEEKPKAFTAPKVETRAANEVREATPNYAGKITFVGQWTGESTKTENSTKEFKAGTDKLGDPISNAGLFRGIAKTFLGWSDKAPVGNGKLAEGARLFSKEDTVYRFSKWNPSRCKVIRSLFQFK